MDPLQVTQSLGCCRNSAASQTLAGAQTLSPGIVYSRVNMGSWKQT